MTVCADEKVLRFQVAVNDILLVQVVEHEDEVGDVEASDVGGDARTARLPGQTRGACTGSPRPEKCRSCLARVGTLVNQAGRKILSAKARQHAQVDDEWVLHMREGAPLRIDMLDLPEPDDRALFENLERKVERLSLVRATRRNAKANQDDSAESTGASRGE